MLAPVRTTTQARCRLQRSVQRVEGTLGKSLLIFTAAAHRSQREQQRRWSADPFAFAQANRSAASKRERLRAWPSFHAIRSARDQSLRRSAPSQNLRSIFSLIRFLAPWKRADDPLAGIAHMIRASAPYTGADNSHSGIAPMIRPLATVLVPDPWGLLRRGLGSAQVRDLICRRKALGCVGESELGCSLWFAIWSAIWSAILPPGWSMLLICAADPRS
jgi:hypothetical protein